ncbi:MAG: aldo/keto reductase [Treponema sp.]|jgi:aryl-alcohol dehydrogenase-like predicted oxidoreductase|nr:aldo/keto reductase [Treponema sp.]
MEKRILGKTGLSISVFAFGGIVVRDTEQTEADSIVAEAVDKGINYFDVAPSYGNSQNILGPALKPHRRKVYLACKTHGRTKDAALEELHNSLKLLHTDYFDVYQMHAVGPEEVDTILGPGGALEAFVSAKERGLVRNIGVTTHFDEVALRLLKSYTFDTLLFPINWACYLKDGLGKAALEEAAALNMGRIAIKGLAGRAKEPKEDGYPKCWYRPLFDDPELADMALRFTMQQDVHTAVSPGDVRMLRLGLSIVEKYQGKPLPLSAGELAELKRRALLVNNPIFPH